MVLGEVVIEPDFDLSAIIEADHASCNIEEADPLENVVVTTNRLT